MKFFKNVNKQEESERKFKIIAEPYAKLHNIHGI
jgi:hypothetical protein